MLMSTLLELDSSMWRRSLRGTRLLSSISSSSSSSESTVNPPGSPKTSSEEAEELLLEEFQEGGSSRWSGGDEEGPSTLGDPPASSVTSATSWELRGSEGPGTGLRGGDSSLYRNAICLSGQSGRNMPSSSFRGDPGLLRPRQPSSLPRASAGGAASSCSSSFVDSGEKERMVTRRPGTNQSYRRRNRGLNPGF